MLCDGLEEKSVKIDRLRQGSWVKGAYMVQARRIKAADSASADEEDVYRPLPSWLACFTKREARADESVLYRIGRTHAGSLVRLDGD